MGIYKIDVDELTEKLEEFLSDRMEGEVDAEVMAQAWNKLADKFDWDDKLKFIKRR